ncbi:MAG: hypothetical protein AB2A00_04930 [Myxococcota bacterium]
MHITRRTPILVLLGALGIPSPSLADVQDVPVPSVEKEPVQAPAQKGSSSLKKDEEPVIPPATPENGALTGKPRPRPGEPARAEEQKRRKHDTTAPAPAESNGTRLRRRLGEGGAPFTGPERHPQTTGRLDARLVEPERNAERKSATVEVSLRGVQLVDPASVQENPRAGQAHLQYRLDDGPVIATTSTRLSFQDLTSGEHEVVVMLAGNDSQPLGPRETLNFTIP